ncbi:LysR family transcriptional regulator [Kaistia sp. 32K]|nr:LysR family transcriptional regulator [Kaistia sp. 32K]
MEAFIAVVSNQSISQAAASLSLTQSAISKRIQSLERDLGVVLLDRTVKPPVPTAIGLDVYESSLKIGLEVEALRRTVAGRSSVTGGLRLGMTQAVCDVLLQDILQISHSHWPELSIQVTTGWANFIVDRLSDGQLDAGIVLMPSQKIFPANVVATSLAEVPMVVVASRNFAQKRSYRLSALHQPGWILNPDGCGFRAELQSAFAKRNLPFKVNLDTYARETQLEMVAAGMGLGLVPLPLLEASPHRANLVAIPVSDFSLRADLWLCHAAAPGDLAAPIQAFGARASAIFRKAARHPVSSEPEARP